jgi:hypothetical protein
MIFHLTGVSFRNPVCISIFKTLSERLLRRASFALSRHAFSKSRSGRRNELTVTYSANQVAKFHLKNPCYVPLVQKGVKDEFEIKV